MDSMLSNRFPEIIRNNYDPFGNIGANYAMR